MAALQAPFSALIVFLFIYKYNGSGMNKMRNFFMSLSMFMVVFLSGCISDQVISQEEMRVQDASAAEVANVPFEKKMDDLASYNVRRDGYVVIKFHESVPFADYSDVVETLRSKKTISGVYAEQGGKQVCGMR